MSATCATCRRIIADGETAWASDWTVISEDHGSARRETRYTCDTCETAPDVSDSTPAPLTTNETREDT